MILRGKIQRGLGRASRLGFPTVNIRLDNKAKIDDGVYYGYLFIENNRYLSAIFIDNNRNIAEAHAVESCIEARAGKFAKLELIKKIRERKFFQNDSDLIKAIENDVGLTKSLAKNT